MKKSFLVPFVACAVLALSSAISVQAAGGEKYSGLVESFGGGKIVVKTTSHSTGTWILDVNTKVVGNVAKYDWVTVELGKSGHAALVHFDERPTGESGVVKGIRNRILTIKSGSNFTDWNVTPETLGDTTVAVGDEIKVKIYRNHNLAEITIIKHGVK